MWKGKRLRYESTVKSPLHSQSRWESSTIGHHASTYDLCDKASDISCLDMLDVWLSRFVNQIMHEGLHPKGPSAVP
jgi:hypothetical protein